MYRYAVFQGGGVKGIALVGALKVVETRGVVFDAVGGASAGAIVAALYAVGYTADEMQLILDGVDFESLLDSAGWAPLAMARKLGLYRGKKFQNWIHEQLERKKVRFFKDCPKNLRIVATDLTARTLVVFDSKNYPDLEVAEAIRMSMSIPIVFEPVRFGQHLMVDGGVLSNFPLSLFDANETLGFRLMPKAESVPFAPEGFRDYATAVIGAMLDGRDNYDVQSKKLAGLIEIDPGKISSTQFNLEKSQKADLFERGVSAASKFFLDQRNTDHALQLDVRGTVSSIRLKAPPEMRDDTEIRFSISALVRIELDGKLLLVKGHRIEQFQPVGGVFKMFSTAGEKLDLLGIKADNKLPIDRDSKADLRVFVPRRSVEPFIHWYLDGRGRETSPWREFYEELVETKILTVENFWAPAFDYVGRRVEGIRWTPHFQCFEVLIAEIFSLVSTPEQAVELKALCLQDERKDIIWASPALIRALGYDSISQRQITRISDHTSWLLLDVDTNYL